jgi:hypothetical protein
MADGTAGGRETMNECMHATVRELFVSDSVKVYRCANCEETLVAILLAQMGESKLWQQAMPVKQLKMVVESLNAENEKLHKQLQAESLAFYLLRDERDNLAAELAAARELLKRMAACNPWNDSPDIPVVDYAAYTNAAKKFIE